MSSKVQSKSGNFGFGCVCVVGQDQEGSVGDVCQIDPRAALELQLMTGWAECSTT